MAAQVAVAAVLGGLDVAKFVSTEGAGKQNLEQIKLVAEQQKLFREEQASKVIGAQKAIESTRGVSLASPSFVAIQANQFNQLSQDKEAISLNAEFKENALDEKMQNIRLAEFSQVIAQGASIVTGVPIPGAVGSVGTVGATGTTGTAGVAGASAFGAPPANAFIPPS